MITPYPHVIENFFKEDELVFMRDHIDYLINNKEFVFMSDIENKDETKDKWLVNHYVGRINFIINKNRLDKKILDCIERESKNLNQNSEFTFIELVRYSNIFGIPAIDPHIDPPSKQAFMFNVQVNSNIEWPLVEFVDGLPVDIVLKDNSCAVMDVNRIVHWRKPTFFNDGDYVDMLFIHFTDQNIEPLPQEHYPHPPSWKKDGVPQSDLYNLEMSRSYPNRKEITTQQRAEIVKNRVFENGCLYPKL